ncbi:MAG TPA: SusE domain-containing protein, partial [Phnomibacter sp.]|nr:SusE domain-containing protein [Phnomibacter sp.]
DLKVVAEGGTPPVLRTSTVAVTLKPGTPAEEAAEALTLSWTNPEYRFNTGISSQDVTYKLELDTSVNFNSPSKYTTSISRDLQRRYSIAELNSTLGNTMQLATDRPYIIRARITSTVGFEALPLVSNVVNFTATPFAPPPLVEPPAAGNLWGVGDAFNSGWSNPLPAPYDVNQKFTRISNTLYEGIFDFKGGGGFKLIQEQGVWSSQYHRIDDGGTAESGNFRKRDAEPGFIGPAAAGKYKMTVNFQTGKYTVVKQ